jgi:hypothetical protein
MAWHTHPRFEAFLTNMREHNRLLVNPVLKSIQNVLDKNLPGADIVSCKEVVDLARERRVGLIIHSMRELYDFGEETKGSVSLVQIDEFLETLKTDTFHVRLLAFDPTRKDHDEVVYKWGGTTKGLELWVVAVSQESDLRDIATALGHDLSSSRGRARARATLRNAGIPRLPDGMLADNLVGMPLSQGQILCS